MSEYWCHRSKIGRLAIPASDRVDWATVLQFWMKSIQSVRIQGYVIHLLIKGVARRMIFMKQGWSKNSAWKPPTAIALDFMSVDFTILEDFSSIMPSIMQCFADEFNNFYWKYSRRPLSDLLNSFQNFLQWGVVIFPSPWKYLESDTITFCGRLRACVANDLGDRSVLHLWWQQVTDYLQRHFYMSYQV